MKKFILVFFPLVLCLNMAFGQYFNFQPYDDFAVGDIYNRPPIKILNYNGKTLVVYQSQLAILDTSTGKFSSLLFPNHDQADYDYIVDAGVDSSGYLYLLRSYSVSLYDGIKWKSLIEDKINYVRFLMIDRDNLVHCIKSNNTDYVWNGTSLHAVAIPLNSERIEYCVGGPTNDCRLVTDAGHMYVFKDDNYIEKPYPHPVSNYFPVQIDKDGYFWYSIRDSIIKLDSTGNEVAFFDNNNSPVVAGKWPGFSIRKDASLLIYVNNDTINLYKNGQWSAFTTYYYNNVVYMHDSDWWLNNADYDNSILNYCKDTLLHSYSNLYYSDNKIRPNCLLNIYYGYNPMDIDVWVGTDSGIYEYRFSDEFQFTLNQKYDTGNTILTSNHITSLCDIPTLHGFFGDSKQDTIFIGTDSGLFVGAYADSFYIFQHYTKANSKLPSNKITSVRYVNDLTHNSELWIGTDSGCARLKFYSGNWKLFNTANSILPSNNINRISWVSDYNVYLCTDSGFVQFNDTVLKAFTPGNSGLPVSNVQDVVEEDIYPHGKRLWIATLGAGLVSYTDTAAATNQWQIENKTNGNYPSDSIHFLYPGRLFNYYADPTPIVCTKDAGMLLYNQYDYFFSNPNYQQLNQPNQGLNIIDYYQQGLDCEGTGWIFISLTDSGFLFQDICYGGVDNKRLAASTLKSWFNQQQLNAEWSELKPGKATLTLYNLMGQSMLNVSTIVDDQQHIAVNTSGLASGLYLLRITQANKAGSQLLPFMR